MSRYRWLGIALAAFLAVPVASASADDEGHAKKRDRAVRRGEARKHRDGDRAVRRPETRKREDNAYTRHPRPTEQSFGRARPSEQSYRRHDRNRDRDNWQGHRYDRHRPYRQYRNHQHYSRPHYRPRVRVHVHAHDSWCGHRGPVISFLLRLGSSYWCDYHSGYCRHDYLCSSGYWMYDEWGYREYWVSGYCTHPRHEHPRSFYDYDYDEEYD